MKKTLLAALLLGTTVTTNVDAALVVEGDSNHHTHSTPNTSDSGVTVMLAKGLAKGLRGSAWYMSCALGAAATLLKNYSRYGNKASEEVKAVSMNEPFGNEPAHIHQLLIADRTSDTVTPPSTRANSVRGNSPEAIETDDDVTNELDLLKNAGAVNVSEQADGLLVTPRPSTFKHAKDYSPEERAEREAFIQMVLAEDAPSKKNEHDPLENSIVFTEEDSIVFVEEDAATPSTASKNAEKPATKPAAKATKKAAPVIRMTRAQKLLAAANKPEVKTPSGKKAVVAN